MTTMTTNRVCPVCKVDYAMPLALYESARINGSSWYCPNGHKLAFPKKVQQTPVEAPRKPGDTQSALIRLEHENAALRAKIRALEADCNCALDMAEAESDARRRLQHRLAAARNRARALRRERNAGVCPWCHHHFENLHRHLAAKHAGFIEGQRNIA